MFFDWGNVSDKMQKMELKVTLLCIGAILAVLAAGAWKVRPTQVDLSPEMVARLREAVVDPVREKELRERIPTGARVLQMGGVGLGHNAAVWKATVVGGNKWAKMEHPEVDFRAGDPSQANLFSSEMFTHVVIRDLEEVEHKAGWIQNAYKWLEPDGVLVINNAQRRSNGGVEWEMREHEGRRTEMIQYRGKKWRAARSVYRESEKTINDMVVAAGFVQIEDGVYVKNAY